MSKSAQEFASETTTVERRFYSRVVPHAPIYLAIGAGDGTLLLNVSENGLLVSAPVALPLNFVARIGIPLSGLPKPVQVNVRVVWSNEVNKQAGIQLLDLSEHDREQIRKWGTRESSQFLHRQPDPVVAAPVPSARPSAAPAVAASPKQPSIQQESVSKKTVAATSVSRTSSPEVTTSTAARIALWAMAVMALCLAALFLVKNNALGNSFLHSKEILHRSSAPIPTPAQDAQIDPQGLRSSTPEAATNVAPPQQPLAATPKSQYVSAGKPALHNSLPPDGGANPPDDAAADEEPAANSGADASEDRLGTSPVNPVASPKPSQPETSSAPSSRPVPDSRAKSQLAPPTSSANPSTSSSASRADVASKSAVPATRTPAPLSPRTGSASSVSLPPHNYVSQVIQMDTPARQVMEIHLQRGSGGAFFSLPGERVLESPSATLHIQRSVRMPGGHSVWPFNRTKKVVIGGLLSRVDPQFAQAQISSADLVRVTATVGENGQVISVKPVFGRATLVPAVLKAVQEWRYQPTLVDGKPVETKADVLIQLHGAPRYSARQ